MKQSRIFLFLSMLILTAALSSCVGGGASQASSWPGLTVKGDTAYLAYNTRVYAINIDNGTERWHYPAEADPKRTFYAPPALTEDGRVVVGSFDHRVYSLDAATGAESTNGWPFNQAKGRFIAGALAINGEIVAPSADSHIYNLGMDGSMHWNYRAGDDLWATPVSDGEKIYVTSMDHRVYALDQENGSLIWKTEDLGGSVMGSPTMSEDGSTLYVGTFGNSMVALDAGSGKTKGSYTTRGWVWSGPALDNGVLYFGDVDGNLYALNEAGLTEKWVVHPDALPKLAIADRPLVIGESLYVASESGTMYIVNTADGTVRTPIVLGGEKGKLNTSPVAAGDLVLVAITGSNNLLVALDQNGGQRWSFTPPE